MFLPSVPQGAKKDRIRGDEHMAIVECASPLIISEAPYCPAHADLLVGARCMVDHETGP